MQICKGLEVVIFKKSWMPDHRGSGHPPAVRSAGPPSADRGSGTPDNLCGVGPRRMM